MKKVFLFVLVVVMGSMSSIQAAPLNVELVMSGGRVWKGQLIKRDGDWIEFSTGISARPIRLGANTIEQINYNVKLNLEQLHQLKEDREFDSLISNLNQALAPFKDYQDIPSNLTRYRSLLMELYFLTEEYDKALAYASQLASDGGDDVALVENAQTYQALSLIESGRSDEAQVLMDQLGWLGDLREDSNPKQLYLGAKLMSVKGEYNQAMELIAYIIAFNSQDTEWMQPAELLCAEMYIKLGMLDSAEEVIRQISLLYPNTAEFDASLILKEKLVELRTIEAIENDS
ncbi:MAG: tetratricopeptide repeat protein [Pontiellaceae bacterium]